ncbi:hypothetical protein [Trueperella bialowiezensis]|uniref:hypothetical protein n=1 Tax=Trueperella bialowiezensis TaxID=312285 RepID=UPI000F82D141|nr:hypothetical protein [Trueperella bialowiezensis]
MADIAGVRTVFTALVAIGAKPGIAMGARKGVEGFPVAFIWMVFPKRAAVFGTAKSWFLAVCSRRQSFAAPPAPPPLLIDGSLWLGVGSQQIGAYLVSANREPVSNRFISQSIGAHPPNGKFFSFI